MLSDAPAYTVDGLIGLAIVNAEWANSVFYCEDSGYEAVYERLLKRLCPELKKFLVVCTGGKTLTQKLAERREDIPVPCFLLVDKDYDDLDGFIERRLKLGLSYIRKYSLENYIAQLDALIEVALEILSDGKSATTKAVLDGKLSDRQEFLSSLVVSLETIARYFVFCQKHRIQIKTCKIVGSEIFPDATDQYPSPEIWFEQFKTTLNKHIELHSEWMLVGGWLDVELSTAFNTKFEPWGRQRPAAHIVGKHLLFGLLTYMDARLGTGLREMGSRELYLRILNHGVGAI